MPLLPTRYMLSIAGREPLFSTSAQPTCPPDATTSASVSVEVTLRQDGRVWRATPSSPAAGTVEMEIRPGDDPFPGGVPPDMIASPVEGTVRGTAIQQSMPSLPWAPVIPDARFSFDSSGIAFDGQVESRGGLAIGYFLGRATYSTPSTTAVACESGSVYWLLSAVDR